MVSDKAANQELVFLPVVKDGNGKSFIWFVDFPAMFDIAGPFAAVRVCYRKAQF